MLHVSRCFFFLRFSHFLSFSLFSFCFSGDDIRERTHQKTIARRRERWTQRERENNNSRNEWSVRSEMNKIISFLLFIRFAARFIRSCLRFCIVLCDRFAFGLQSFVNAKRFALSRVDSFRSTLFAVIRHCMIAQKENSTVQANDLFGWLHFSRSLCFVRLVAIFFFCLSVVS